MSGKTATAAISLITNGVQRSLAKALATMTGTEFTVSPVDEGGGAVSEPLIWEQSFSFSPEPCLWICAGRDLWTSAGQLTLAAVGIDSVTDDDCRSTWQEILSQTIGGFCSFLSSELKREITADRGGEAESEPGNSSWLVVAATDANGATSHLKIGWSGTLLSLWERAEPQKSSEAPKDATLSKTFDLLLDVALPVSVSFGRTSLEVREVLKLNTGSIVELNRLVAEPVEVIVNDCVIARGEVVVVDGNYGVRITQLSSREDRLKSGIGETPAKFGVAAR